MATRRKEIELPSDLGEEVAGPQRAERAYAEGPAKKLRRPRRRNPRRQAKLALRFMRMKSEASRDYEPFRKPFAREFLPDISVALVTTSDLRSVHRKLQDCFDAFRNRKEWEFTASAVRMTFFPPARGRARIGVDCVRSQGRVWERLLLGVMDAFKAVGPHLRFCREATCPEILLVSHGGKKFCAAHLKEGERKRAAEWQRDHAYAQRKRDLARAAYERTHPGAERRPSAAR